MTDKLPAAPFAEWVEHHVRAVGGITALEETCGVAPESLRHVLRFRRPVDLDLVDRCTTALGMDSLWTLYPYVPARTVTGRKRPSHAGQPYTVPESVLLEAHRRHIDDGLSLRAMGREYFDRCGAKTPAALSRILRNAFKQRGWETLSHADAVARFNRAKVSHLPRCSHIHAIGPHRGEQCARRTSKPSGTCWRHDRERLATLEQRLRPSVAA